MCVAEFASEVRMLPTSSERKRAENEYLLANNLGTIKRRSGKIGSLFAIKEGIRFNTTALFFA